MVRQKDTPSSSARNTFSIGIRLRDIRKSKGITLKDIAYRLEYTSGYISSIETGSRPLPRDPEFIQRYARALEIYPEEMDALIRTPGYSLVERSNIPYNRNDFFIGREDEIKFIHDYLMSDNNGDNICAITGIAGIGKTTMAVEYAFRYRDEYQFILWISADTADELSGSFARLANFLDLPEKNAQDRKKTTLIVEQWLKVNSRCLLIFDSMDEASINENFLARLGRNHIIITTRTQLFGPTIQNVELAQVSKDDSMLLLLRQSGSITPREDKIPEALKDPAQQITSLLGRLPFAISQAATYIEETRCGLPYYLGLLQREQQKILEKFGSPETRATIAVWSLSFQKIKESNLGAAELLCLCAFLHPDTIHKEFLLEGSPVLSPELKAITKDMEKLQRSIKEFLRYSLVQNDTRSGAFSMHRLVQATIRNSLVPAKQRQLAEYAVRVVNIAFPLNEVATWHISWSKCQRYFHQARACVDLITEWKIANIESRQLLQKLGRYLVERTEFKQAEHIYQLALELDKQTKKENDVIVDDLLTLAEFYRMRKNDKRAEDYYKQATRFPDVEVALNKRKDAQKVQATNRKVINDGDKVANSADTVIKYNGTWEHNKRRWGDYGNDAHVTNELDASFQYTFTGCGIEIISDPSSFRGELDIFIDGNYVQTVSAANFEGQISQTIIFSDVSLLQGEHTIEGRLAYGTFALDALAFYAEEGT